MSDAQLIVNEPEAVYHARSAVSNSMLRVFAQSPALYRATFITGEVEPEQTDNMTIGSLVHALVLEPHNAEKLVHVIPDDLRRDKRSKAYQAELEAANGREIIRQKDYDTARHCADALREHPILRDLVSGDGYSEATILWQDADTGIECRGRVDRICTIPGRECLIDLKTASNASPLSFRRSVVDYSYHTQAAMYCDGAAAAGVAGAESWPFLFAVVEKQPPYQVAIYTLSDQDIGRARDLYQNRLRRLKRCIEKDEWPSYTSGVGLLTLPEWAFSDGGVGMVEI